MTYKTYSYRIKDSSKSLQDTFRKMSGAVNFVWNFCNETQLASLKKGKASRDWLSAFDFMKLTSGSSKELGVSSTTVQITCEEYAARRKQFKKSRLNWRSGKKSLGWIPFKAGAISLDQASSTAVYRGVGFSYWNSRPVEGQIKTGCISSDSRGRWYLNLTCELPDFQGPLVPGEVGIDLGLKDVVTTNTGLKVAAPRYFRQYQNKLAKFQRAGKKRQTRNLHTKVKNARKDFNHKLSTSLVKEFSYIVVGNVSPSGLAKTNMAKSIYDVSWFQLKTFLKYKASARGSSYKEVNEAYSTQTCSACGVISNSSPKGVKDLSVREWICSECGTIHDRDVNAARNILRFGHESPPTKAVRKPRSAGILGTLVPGGCQGESPG